MLLPGVDNVVDVVTTVADGIATCQSGLLFVNVICGRWNGHRNNPSLNKNIGKYHLPHIWDEVLVNITELQLS